MSNPQHTEGLRTKRLLAVAQRMPIMSQLALSRFVRANPSWNGAGWAEVLDVLDDSDSDLEVVEPVYDALEPLLAPELRGYISLVTLTMHWAQPDRPINNHAVLLRIRAIVT
jgi:hypothetical protein